MTAQAIETRSAIDPQGRGPEGESAVAKPCAPDIDIYEAIKRKRESIDWKALHERKREPIDLPDRVRRGWRF